MNENPISLIKEESKIAIISHMSPDGDSIGSILGLGLFLMNISKDVNIYIDEKLPSRYDFLPGSQFLKVYKDDNKKFDFCFVLDCGDADRLGHNQSILSKSSTIINIDHHISNTNFGDVNIINTNMSSTCELIFSLLKNYINKLNKDIATCLYMGILTDTGNFIYDNTTANTHKAVSELMEYNIDINIIVQNLYQNKSLNSIRFLGHVLNNFKILFNGKAALVVVTQELLKEYDIELDEIDGVINYVRDIEGVEIAILLKEITDDEVKISFRSKYDIDVNDLAKRFNGGGHKKAAGARVKGNIGTVENNIINQLKLDLGW
ncbi:MAG: bifunctional oligoribonuclease/PAP phosphatase NrnA [Clostridiales bacterium]|nr:bifunctional oligoribonuclease/PAP phosphatase NrnA [Clostridiales bacterium]